MKDVTIDIDVTEAAGLGERLHTRVTVTLPDTLSDPPIACFAFPGGGYSLGTGFNAYHFVVDSFGTSNRGAESDHQASFYVIGPGGT